MQGSLVPELPGVTHHLGVKEERSVAQQHSRLLYDVVHPVYAVCRLQVSVVLFVSPVLGRWVGVGGGRLLVPLHQCVSWLLGKAALLQVPLLVVLIPFGMIRPYFGYDGVLALVVLDGHREAHVLLDGVFDLVELLPHVVGRVVLGAGRRRPAVAALLPPPPHAPQKHEEQHESPDDDESGAEERHQVV